MKKIFRQEVLDAVSAPFHGPIILARPVSSWVLAGAATLIVSSVLIYLSLGSYTKRVSTVGMLAPAHGFIRIVPPLNGVVTDRRVEEGQHVRQGQVLFTISDERRQLTGSEVKKVSDLRAETQQQRRETLLKAKALAEQVQYQAMRAARERLSSLRQDIRRNKQEGALLAQRKDEAQRVLDRYRSLAQSGYIAELGLQEKKDQVALLEGQLLELLRQGEESLRQVTGVEDELRQIPLRAQIRHAELDRDLAALSQEVVDAEMRDNYVVTAPADGVVTGITVELGQAVSGQAIALLLPSTGGVVAHLFPTSRAIGFIQPGQKVWIRLQAYPYQKFGQYPGTVIDVTRSSLPPDSFFKPPLPELQEYVYRVTVRLEKQVVSLKERDIPLLPGMVLEADIEQDRRRLIQWVLEPLQVVGTYIS